MKKIILSIITLLCINSLFALDGREIVQKALDVKDPNFTQSQVQMDLIEKNGAKDTRIVREYGRSKNNLKSVVMIFLAPASVKDTRFLLQENSGNAADDKFIYLPDLRSTRRISTAEGSKSFMGTDASYDDLSTRDIDVDSHELLREEEKNGYSCYVVKSKAKNPGDSQYGYRIQWIDKETWIPVYAELYDKKEKLQKVLTVEKLEKITGATGESYNIPMINSMKNVQTGHETKLAIQKIILDKPIPAKVFTQNFLNTGK